MGHVGFVVYRSKMSFKLCCVSTEGMWMCFDGKECHERQCVLFVSGTCSILQWYKGESHKEMSPFTLKSERKYIYILDKENKGYF